MTVIKCFNHVTSLFDKQDTMLFIPATNLDDTMKIFDDQARNLVITILVKGNMIEFI
jgi:hypothetical protein